MLAANQAAFMSTERVFECCPPRPLSLASLSAPPQEPTTVRLLALCSSNSAVDIFLSCHRGPGCQPGRVHVRCKALSGRGLGSSLPPPCASFSPAPGLVNTRVEDRCWKAKRRVGRWCILRMSSLSAGSLELSTVEEEMSTSFWTSNRRR